MLEERTCPQCRSIYAPPQQFCNRDGQPLQVTHTLISRVFSQKYEILDWLGGGGMATVYRAMHKQMGEEVAVKVLNPEMMARENLVKRFRNEARAAMRVNHPNAIRVMDLDKTEDNLHYLVMEILQGQTLREYVQKEKRHFRQLINLIGQACEAMAAAHQQGIIHRDLKPENIIVIEQAAGPTAKVLDFGIARMPEESTPEGKGFATVPGTVLGTPQYMSPEQIRGEYDLTPASDIYSLGVITYELFTGRTPFTFPATADPVAYRDFKLQLETEAPPSLRSLIPQIPPRIEEIVTRALAKNPKDRQASAAELAEQLRGATYVSGTLYEQKTAKMVPTPPPAAPQRPAWVFAGGGLVLAGLLGIGAYWFFMRAAPTQPLAVKPAVASKPAIPAGMVLIPGGKFVQGRTNGDEDERPPLERQLKDFYLDRYEVTNRQYAEFVRATEYPPPNHWQNGAYAPGDEELPVTYVTWRDAQAYANWAKKRLPTEAEWEYAARGGAQGLRYPWGNEWQVGVANLGESEKRLRPVQDYPNDQSPFGVFGMGGNVSEWVEDLYFRYGTKTPMDSDCPECRVYRGGNFYAEKGGRVSAQNVTATYRWSFFPEVPDDKDQKKGFFQNIAPFVGFRCAQSPQ